MPSLITKPHKELLLGVYQYILFLHLNITSIIHNIHPAQMYTHDIKANCLTVPPREGAELLTPAPATAEKHQALLQLTFTDVITPNNTLIEIGVIKVKSYT